MVYRLREVDPGRTIREQKSWHSTDNVSNKDFIRLATKIMEEFGLEAKLVMCWANISQKGHWHTEHTHPGSSVVAVLMVKDTNPGDKEDGVLVINDKPVDPRMKEGEVLLFPSDTPHRVTENKQDEDRITIAFNFKQF